MKIILVPFDFSEVAENALNTAKFLAKKMDASIHVAHFYSISVVEYSNPDAIMTADVLTQLRKEAKEGIADIKKKLEEEGLTVQTTVEMGSVNDEIVLLAEKLTVDLIIMGTTGASGIINKVLGSNAAHVMMQTMRPILLIPHGFVSDSFNNVVYLDELKEDDTMVLRDLFVFAEISGVQNIKLLNVNTGFFFQPINEELMEKLDNEFGLEKIKLETIDGLNLKDGLEHYLEKHFVDLLVMSTHKKSFIERIFGKNSTVKVAQYTKIPLLVFHKK